MEYFSTTDVGRVFVLRLDAGDYVRESIVELVQKERIRDAVVISAIGTLDQCTLHMVMTTGFPAVEHFERWKDKPLEVTSIDGIIADGKPHLHMTVADSQRAYGGHLEPGCRVLYLAEIVIMELRSADLIRIHDEKNLLKLVKKTTIGSKLDKTLSN